MILQYFLSEILSVSFTVDLLQIIQQKYPGIICPFWNLSFTALQAQLDNLHSAMICDFLSGYISILTVSIATTMIKQPASFHKNCQQKQCSNSKNPILPLHTLIRFHQYLNHIKFLDSGIIWKLSQHIGIRLRRTCPPYIPPNYCCSRFNLCQ